MKLIVIGDHREQLLDTLEVILKHWGYRVMVSSSAARVETLLCEMPVDLLIMGSRLLKEETSALKNALRKAVSRGTFPFILLRDEDATEFDNLAAAVLPVPVDVFSLFQLIQKYLEKIPRRNMRLTVQLPGMVSTGGEFRFAEVLSLSVQGMFLKNSSRLQKGDRVRVLFPLLGMKKEMELEGKVLYHILPGVENNYLEGVGIEFSDLSAEDDRLLETFIEKSFLGELEGAIPPPDPALENPPAGSEPPSLALKMKKTA
ncbi:MAG: PilZ domain-containing protein [Deltaproteobacteria bacterium]|nr:PilZ domain-containing protein [Deltaproteobacteria bacterium]